MRTRRRGIPVTTPARTISDLRRSVSSSASPPPVSRSGSPGSVSPSELRQAIRRAEVLGLPIDEQPGADRTRSELERRFLRLCRRSGLPRPEVNAPVAGLTVDFLWRERGLIVETDGYRYHRGRIAFEEDRARDLRLRSRGLEVIRLTYRQVADEPEEVVLLLSSLLRTQRP